MPSDTFIPLFWYCRCGIYYYSRSNIGNVGRFWSINGVSYNSKRTMHRCLWCTNHVHCWIHSPHVQSIWSKQPPHRNHGRFSLPYWSREESYEGYVYEGNYYSIRINWGYCSVNSNPCGWSDKEEIRNCRYAYVSFRG